MRRIVSVALVAGLFAVGLALPALTAQNSPAQDAGDSTRPGPTRRFPPSRCIRQGGPSESTRAAATATSTNTVALMPTRPSTSRPSAAMPAPFSEAMEESNRCGKRADGAGRQTPIERDQ